MHAVDGDALQDISTRLAARMIEVFDLDTSSVALDMTNFATYIDTTNGRAPIAQRGKAKQKRTDLRLVGLGHGRHPGRRDPAGLARLPRQPARRHPVPDPDRPPRRAVCTQPGRTADRSAGVGGGTGGADPAAMTVVFDAGQNSAANFEHLRASGLHYVGSVPPSDCPDLLALPASRRTPVDKTRFPGLTAIDTHRDVYGQHRRVVLTHSQNLHDDQARSFTDTTLAKVGRKLDDLAATLARGKTRRTRDQVTAEIEKITHDPWVRQVIDWNLTGETPRRPPADLEHQPHQTESVGNKGVRQTDPDHRPRPTGPSPTSWAATAPNQRSNSAFRQLKDPHEVSFSPMYHWTDHNIAVHTFTCVLALQLAHLLRLQGPPRRPRPVRQGPPGHPGRDPGNRADLPLHRRPTQGPPHHHRHDRRPAGPLRPVRPEPMGPRPTT